jgi:hypothetical protein
MFQFVGSSLCGKVGFQQGIGPCWNLSDSVGHVDGYACREEFIALTWMIAVMFMMEVSLAACWLTGKEI